MVFGGKLLGSLIKLSEKKVKMSSRLFFDFNLGDEVTICYDDNNPNRGIIIENFVSSKNITY